MVLNKPYGLPVQGGEKVKVSLDSILSEKYKPRPLLVHRLDRDTSGLILVAKSREAAADFSALFATRETSLHYAGNKADREKPVIVKQYMAFCYGVVEPDEGTITLSLDVKGKGKGPLESETFYRRLAYASVRLPDGSEGELSLSLLELELGTGRTHQIRRHLALKGFPLLGDDKYGNFQLNRKLMKTLGLKRMLLHASRLVIPPSPRLPDGLEVTAPLPDYFSRFIETLNSRLDIPPPFPMILSLWRGFR